MNKKLEKFTTKKRKNRKICQPGKYIEKNRHNFANIISELKEQWLNFHTKRKSSSTFSAAD